MADFIHAAPWVQPHGSGPVTPSRLRSLAPSQNLTPPNKTVTKSISSPQLKHTTQAARFRSDSELNTIPDPRAATPQLVLSRSNSGDSTMHPDLSQEVATLSTKLIDAINHQTFLDDNLQQTRHELDTARERLAKLELQVKVHEQKVAKGLLMDKEVYDKMEKQLSSEYQEEKRRRVEAEKAKRKTDNEVETLTAALFEEANVMVAAARKETEASERRNDQLKQQLSDAEILQINLQEQLQDLKSVMEKMSAHGDDESNTLPTTTAPSTPGITPADKMSKMFETNGQTPHTPSSDEITPNHPLHFTHLIHPVLRSDLSCVKDFQEMLKTSAQRSAPSSRVSSGSYGTLNVLGLGSLTNASSSSLPLTKSSNAAGTSTPRESGTGANLKDEKFYKRALSEDIEPTLRLDIAPGLSYFARRTVLNSITAGSLVVEPAPPPPTKFRLPIQACSLCGEYRKDDEFARNYRFKTSETDETRYPLCEWCLGRVRSTCDYISFLRMVAAGHWRAETEDEKKSAWEESVRLRERMFWSRIGGGVVPAFVALRESPRSPTFANVNEAAKLDAIRSSEDGRLSEEALDSAVDMKEPSKKSVDDPFQSKGGDAVKRVSIGKTVISIEPEKESELPVEIEAIPEVEAVPEVETEPEVKPEAAVEHEVEPVTAVEPEIKQEATVVPEAQVEPEVTIQPDATAETETKVEPEAEAEPKPTDVLTQEDEKKIEEDAEAQLQEEVHKSVEVRSTESKSLHQRSASTPTAAEPSSKKRDDRLSLAIPGAFH